MNKIQVSVIVPFYYGNKYIENIYETIRKNVEVLKNHKYNNILELIIVNDSPNEKINLPSQLMNYKIQFIEHKKNFGIQQARVTGLSHASGDYIIFLDQDDELSEDCIYKELEQISTADVLVCNAWLENSAGEKTLLYRTKGMLKNALQLEPYLIGHNRIVSPGQCMIKRVSIPSAWITNIMDVNGSDDLFLWILLFAKGGIFKGCPEAVYIHKYTGENLSAESEKMTISTISMIKYLRKIDYVLPSLVDELEKDRMFSLEWNNYSVLQKIQKIFLNGDILVKRTRWKIRSLI